VKEKELLQMNGIHMNVATLSRVLGTAIAGIFLVIMSLSTMYLLSLGAYLLLVVFTFFLTIEENDVTETERSKAESSFTLLFPIIKELPIV
ncbi:hypothetical protein R0J91_16495, partial [Micrococcus sp. SIMBA_131]